MKKSEIRITHSLHKKQQNKKHMLEQALKPNLYF